MENELDAYGKKMKRRKVWQRIVSMLTCICVFCTTYALILPAITLSAEADCGIEEHTHTEDCYAHSDVTKLACDCLHTHSAQCYGASGELVCGVADYVLHTHSDECFDEEGTCVCPLPVVVPHRHTDSCYVLADSTIPICGLEEGEEHTHGEGCYGEPVVQLVCTLPEIEEHTHTADCYQGGSLICGKLETQWHSHSEACYRTVSVRGALLCEIEEHTHTEDCFTSTLESLGKERATYSLRSSSPAPTNLLTLGKDLENFVVTATKKTEYDPGSGNFAVSGLQMDFRLSMDMFDAIKNGTYGQFYVDLPADVKIKDENPSIMNQWKDATDAMFDGNAFRFMVKQNSDGTYRILIEYYGDYIEYITTQQNTNDSHVKFDGTLDKDLLDDKGDIVIKWDDTNSLTTTIKKEDITYPNDQTARYDINTTKTGIYDAVNKQLIYTVKVSSQKGTGATVDVNDVLTLNGVTVNGYPTVTIKKGDQTVTGYAPTFVTTQKDKLVTNITGLPALNANESYEITYTYNINEPTQQGVTWSPNNSATAKADSPDKEIEKKGETTVTVKKQSVEKSGVYDSANEKIKWTIVVNPEQADIAGFVLRDDMLYEGIQNRSFQIVNDNGDPAGENIQYQQITDRTTGETYIKFLAMDSGGNCSSYTITYETQAPRGTIDYQVTNKAEFEDPDPDKPKSDDTQTVTVPGLVDIAKSGALTTTTGEGTTTNATVAWQVTVTLPSGGITTGTEIVDYNGNNEWTADKTHWMTKTQVDTLVNELKKVFGEDGYEISLCTDSASLDVNWVSASEVDANTKYYGWRVRFTDDKTLTGEKSINYQTVSQFDTQEVKYGNSVKIGKEYTWKSAYAEVEYKATLIKYGTDNKTVEDTYITNSTDGILKWFICVTPDTSSQEFDLYDYLPEGLTVRKLSLSKWSSSATEVTGTSGKLKGDKLIATYEISANDNPTYNPDGTKIKFHITCVDNAWSEDPASQNFPEDTEVWVYLECQIDPLPGAGESYDRTFTNYAQKDSTIVWQTQHISGTIPDGVVKMDATASGESTRHDYDKHDPTVKWMIKVYFPNGMGDFSANPVTIKEKIPEGLTVKSFGVGSSDWEAKNSSNGSGSLIVSVGSKNASGSFAGFYNFVEGTYSVDNGILTLNVNKNNNSAAKYLYLYLICSIDPDASFEPVDPNDPDSGYQHAFKNEVEVSINGTSYGSDSQTQTVEKTGNENTLVKSGTWDDDDNKMSYSVLINGDAKQLNGGNAISVTDTLSYYYSTSPRMPTASLLPASVKLYTVETTTDSEGNTHIVYENGKPKKGAAVTSWQWTSSSNLNEVLAGSGNTVNHTISATIPDGQAFYLEYTYQFVFSGNSDVDFSLNNEITLNGATQGSDNISNNVKWHYSSISGGASSSGNLTINKVEKGNEGNLLGGAVFTVYNMDGTPLEYKGKVVSYTTNAYGQISIAKGMGYFEDDTVYYVVETRAPDGYALPANPQKIYFYFGSKNGTVTGTIPEGTMNLNDMPRTVKIENEKSPLDVDKSWIDKNGDTMTDLDGITSITFRLKRRLKAAEGETPAEFEYFGEEYRIEARKNWQLTLPNVPMVSPEGKAYEYTVEETGIYAGDQSYTDKLFTLTFSFTTDGKAHLTNTESDTCNIALEKNWESGLTAHNVQFELWRAQSDSPTDMPTVPADMSEEEMSKIATRIQTFDASSTKEFKNLLRSETKNGQKVYYSYFIVERADSYAKVYSSNTFIVEGTIEIANSIPKTAVTVEKKWEADVPDKYRQNGVELTLYRVSSETAIGTNLPAAEGGTPYGDAVQITENDGWKYEWSNLPLYAVENGVISEYYAYYVVETPIEGLTPSYDITTSVTGGTITVTNGLTNHYELPVTGGSGTFGFTFVGLMLMSACAVLLVIRKKSLKGM